MADDQTTVLITGSTDGVGRRVAERLAGPGTTVLVHGRNRGRAEEVVDAIRRSGGTARSYIADLASLSEVCGLAAAVRRDHARLDVLINNAGIGVGRPEDARQLSRDGFELRVAVNYLAGFLLTRSLLPFLTARRGGRIINVASAGQQPIDFADVMFERGYGGRRAYCQSKLAQVMFTFDLAEELGSAGVTATCLHPASYMDTTMVRRDGIAPMSTVDEGADAILHLATSPDLAGRTGLYFDGLRPSRANGHAYDATARATLRGLSARLVDAAAPAEAPS